jgi:phosphoglycolate phosphatase-like HAD superfamily hydrolase
MTKIDTLIFDMDGVITTEEKYWACARLTLWELVTQRLCLPHHFQNVAQDVPYREVFLPSDLIYALKDRAVNSNWDITYILACTYLGALRGIQIGTITSVEAFLDAVRVHAEFAPVAWPDALSEFLNSTLQKNGQSLIAAAGDHLAACLGVRDGDLFAPEKAFWWYLHARFQRFYRGEAMQDYHADRLIDGTAIPAGKIESTLQVLSAAGYTLGTATGRPDDELEDALGDLGLLRYFDPARFGTLTAVRAAETALKTRGLVKPHPYSLLRALYPETPPEKFLDPAFQTQPRPNVIMIGDSPSDPIMAKAAGCRCVGVLTGVRGEAAKAARAVTLKDLGCEVVLPDITHLPEWLNHVAQL